MASLSKVSVAFKALTQLGVRPVALNALYRFGLATGHYRRVTSHPPLVASGQVKAILPLPSREELLVVLGESGRAALLAEADEIVAGKVRLFGAEPVELNLTIPGKLKHWTAYETGKSPIPYSLITNLPAPASKPANLPTCDVKLLWEPARFGWAFTLGRAYHLSGDEKYPKTFWRDFETFADANPPFLGPHWMSAQEVAIRLMAFVWAGQVFGASPASTPERKARLAAAVAAHATRIPPTLVYARSQQNNHLLTEAAGLLTAGLALPDAPESARWRRLGWKWLNRGLQEQIDAYGEYSQHSTNYHRLMLQVVLWVTALNTKGTIEHEGNLRESLSPSCLEKLAVATHWLLALLDPDSGRTPNLGANDGAYLFPFTNCPYSDLRPVAHAAARLFLDYDLPHGPWDEMALWFGVPAAGPKSVVLPRYVGDQVYGKESWAYLRTAQFTSRPSHADQLHLDLWWRGLNVAQDAGTYLYNAEKPWDNVLTTAFVHNTVTVNGRDQFTHAGRFLYLDWFNAYRSEAFGGDASVIQSVRGRYHVRGYRHTRTVSACEGEIWRVVDEIMPRVLREKKPRVYRLHWLLPDWEWELENGELGMVLRLASPLGPVVLTINHHPASTPCAISLARAGEMLSGDGNISPERGWTSPTYGVKIPALSLAAVVESRIGITFSTEFTFPASNR